LLFRSGLPGIMQMRLFAAVILRGLWRSVEKETGALSKKKTHRNKTVLFTDTNIVICKIEEKRYESNGHCPQN